MLPHPPCKKLADCSNMPSALCFELPIKKLSAHHCHRLLIFYLFIFFPSLAALLLPCCCRICHDGGSVSDPCVHSQDEGKELAPLHIDGLSLTWGSNQRAYSCIYTSKWQTNFIEPLSINEDRIEGAVSTHSQPAYRCSHMVSIWPL